MRFRIIIFCLFLLFFSSGCGNGNESTKPIKIKEDYIGEIIDIKQGSFLLQFGEDKSISLTANSAIIEELTIGDKVIVEIDGGVNDSNPLQAQAKKVLIIE